MINDKNTPAQNGGQNDALADADLGERLAKCRKETNISQDELAEKLNVSRQAVSNWERNKTQPDVSSIIKICGIFGLSIDEFIRGEKKMKNTEKLHGDKAKTPGGANKYDVAIGLFYAVGMFLAIGMFLVVGLIFMQWIVWAAALAGAVSFFFVFGLLSHAIITLVRKDQNYSGPHYAEQPDSGETAANESGDAETPVEK